MTSAVKRRTTISFGCGGTANDPLFSRNMGGVLRERRTRTTRTRTNNYSLQDSPKARLSFVVREGPLERVSPRLTDRDGSARKGFT